MTPSSACSALVTRFEGCRLRAYPDPGTGGNPWTVGYGATGQGITPTTQWTQEECDARLAVDLARFGRSVDGLLAGAPTTQPQFDAMVSFSYNVGLKNFAISTLLKMHKQGNSTGAADEFLLWTHAAGKILPGLVTRRAAERDLYRSAT
jgi:lysozyme